ncbi:MAG: transporter [Candidatus Binataceae bacterium]
MLESVVRHKGLAAAIAIATLLSFLEQPSLAQTPPAAAPGAPSAAALQIQSQQLEQELFDEHRKLQSLENQFYNLRKQMQTLHPASTGVTAGAQATSKPTHQVTAQSAGNSANNSETTRVRASSTSRKTPATSVAVRAAYQQENALFEPGLTFYPQFQYSYTNSQNLVLNGFLAFNAILLGSINVSQNETNIFNWNPQLFYAFNRHFQLDVNVPYFFEQATFKSIGASNTTGKQSKVTVNKWGIGDASGGFYWQVMDQHGYWPNVIWNTQVSAPTGTSPYGIKLLTDPTNTNLKYPSNLPTGKGVWGISSGLSIIREFDPVVLFASGNYYYEFTESVDDISTTVGKTVPGDVAPGDAMSYTLGVTTALNERLSTLFEVQDIITNSSEIKPKGGFWATVPNSDTNAAQFILGATYAASHNLFPFVQAGIGATTAAPNFQISLWVPYYFSNSSLF